MVFFWVKEVRNVVGDLKILRKFLRRTIFYDAILKYY